MVKPKPFVAVACVCEKVLQEADNVASIIRIVDTFFIKLPPAEELPEGKSTALHMTAFVSIKSGDVTGSHELGLVLRSPSGKRGETVKWPVVLIGGEAGAQLVVNFAVQSPQLTGLYWFDVLWEDEILTSIPFKLRPAPAQEQGTTAS